MSTDNHKSVQDETYIIVVGDQKDNDRLIDMKFMEDNDNDGVDGDDDTNNENKQSNENTKNGKSTINKPGRKSKKPLSVSATNKKTCCRLCLSYNCSKMIPLFGGTQLRFMNINIVTVIESCIGLNVSEDDDLPNSICNVCLSRLENCWAFRQQCHKSDTLMHEINQAKKQFCELSKNSSSKSTSLKRNSQSMNKDNYGSMFEDNNEDYDELKKMKAFLEGNNFKSEFGKRFKRERISGISNKSKDNESTVDQNYISEDFEELKDEENAEEELFGDFAEDPEDVNNTVTNYKRSKSSSFKCCDICGKNLKTDQQVLEHKQLYHFNEYPYKCMLCYRLFKTESSLSIHVRHYHSKDIAHCSKTVECYFCKCFVKKTMISDHVLQHLGNIKDDFIT